MLQLFLQCPSTPQFLRLAGFRGCFGTSPRSRHVVLLCPCLRCKILFSCSVLHKELSPCLRPSNLFCVISGLHNTQIKQLAAPSRVPCPLRVSAFEKAVRRYANNLTENVITPTLGTSFDSLGEAYAFYNLYSWENGFGIKYRKSRFNVERTKCMQEIVCECSVSRICEVVCCLILFVCCVLFR